MPVASGGQSLRQLIGQPNQRKPAQRRAFDQAPAVTADRILSLDLARLSRFVVTALVTAAAGGVLDR